MTKSEARTTDDDICCRCGHAGSDIVLRIDDLKSIVRCRTCRIARTCPYPKFNYESQEKYSSFYVDNEILFRSFARSIIDSVKPYKSAGTLLDIGCAVGYLLDAARDAGFIPTAGIELNKDAAAIAAGKGHTVFTGPPEEIQFGASTYDVISFNHVLEHIREFRPFLAKIRELLKPDGIIYCGAPNYDSLMCRLLGRSWYGWGMPDHVWHFDLRTFASIMDEAGFEPRALIKNELYYPYSKSLRKNTRAALARLAGRLGLGDQVYGIFARKR